MSEFVFCFLTLDFSSAKPFGRQVNVLKANLKRGAKTKSDKRIQASSWFAASRWKVHLFGKMWLNIEPVFKRLFFFTVKLRSQCPWQHAFKMPFSMRSPCTLFFCVSTFKTLTFTHSYTHF